MFQLQDESSSWRGKGGGREGGGAYVRGRAICGTLQPPPHPVSCDVTCKVDNLVMLPVRLTIMTTTAVFWNNNSFAECVLHWHLC